MSSFIKIIDEALKTTVFEKFKTDMGLTTQNTSLVFEPRDVVLRKIAEKRGQNSVEIISLWRERFDRALNRENVVLSKKGIPLAYSDGTQSGIWTAKAAPIKIDYSLRFWSRSLEKVTQAAETFIFWKWNTPKLIFNYETDYPLEMNINPELPILDESTIVRQYDIGLYYVSLMNFSVEGWLLTTPSSSKTILTIILKVYTREVVDGTNLDTLVGTYTVEGNLPSSGA